jgi:hypothetical protein
MCTIAMTCPSYARLLKGFSGVFLGPEKHT